MKVAIVCLLLFATPLFATDPNPSTRQRELIDELLTLTKPEELVRKGLDQMLAQMMKAAEQEAGDTASDAERERRAEAKKDFDRFRELLRDTLDYKQIVRDIYMPLYSKYFSEQQLADIVAFYKSPAGQRFVSVQSDLQNDAMTASNDMLVDKIGDVAKQVTEEHAKRRPWEKTMRDIRTLATAVEAWATDHDEKYPGAQSMDQLRKELQPTYVKEMPEKDPWGNAYAYVVSTDRDHYRIVSSGSDSVFDWDSRRIVVPTKKPQSDEGFAAAKLADRLEDDIIYADGLFVQIPRAAQHDQ